MNWFPLPNWKAMLVAVALGLVAWLAVSNWGYRKELQLTGQRLSTEQLKNSKQAGLIVTLHAQDAQNRALAAAQQQHAQQLRQQYDILQRKFREAIKDNPCAAERMPDAVVELLQQNSTAGARAGNNPAPETVFTPCEQPGLQGNTWGDAVSYTLALQTALLICAGQVVTLNQWRTSLGR